MTFQHQDKTEEEAQTTPLLEKKLIRMIRVREETSPTVDSNMQVLLARGVPKVAV